MANSGGRHTVDSVENALKLLLLFRDNATVRVSAAADHLDVARSTAHRLLTTFVKQGFAVQDSPSRVYRPGPRLMEVGQAAMRNLDVRGRARPHLEQLAVATGETVSLLVPERGNVRFVESIESRSTVRVASRYGLDLPTHATSGGKAILARMSPEALAELYPDEELRTVTAATIGTRTRLLAELDEVRDRGYATNNEESEIGLGAAGVAVCDLSGSPTAAITVAGPVQRMQGDHLADIVTAMRRCATRIATSLYG
jgi:DNA-binding IclR family transcriptional regulator